MTLTVLINIDHFNIWTADHVSVSTGKHTDNSHNTQQAAPIPLNILRDFQFVQPMVGLPSWMMELERSISYLDNRSCFWRNRQTVSQYTAGCRTLIPSGTFDQYDYIIDNKILARGSMPHPMNLNHQRMMSFLIYHNLDIFIILSVMQFTQFKV